MDAASVEAAFHVEPETPGSLAWEGETLVFQPRGALSPATAYTLTVDASATSQHGRPLAKPYVARFRTRMPQLLYLGRPYPGAEHRHLFLAPLDSRSPRRMACPLGLDSPRFPRSPVARVM